jgi:hypothetical protein
MIGPNLVMSVGAFCFGVTIGYITYRTLVRTEKPVVSDIATVIGAVGGAAVTGLFDPRQGDAFGWYSIGLLTGIAAFFLLFLALNGRRKTAVVMLAGDIGRHDPAPEPAPNPNSATTPSAIGPQV